MSSHTLLKEELQHACRDLGLSTDGNKFMLFHRMCQVIAGTEPMAARERILHEIEHADVREALRQATGMDKILEMERDRASSAMRSRASSPSRSRTRSRSPARSSTAAGSSTSRGTAESGRHSPSRMRSSEGTRGETETMRRRRGSVDESARPTTPTRMTRATTTATAAPTTAPKRTDTAAMSTLAHATTTTTVSVPRVGLFTSPVATTTYFMRWLSRTMLSSPGVVMAIAAMLALSILLTTTTDGQRLIVNPVRTWASGIRASCANAHRRADAYLANTKGNVSPTFVHMVELIAEFGHAGIITLAFAAIGAWLVGKWIEVMAREEYKHEMTRLATMAPSEAAALGMVPPHVQFVADMATSPIAASALSAPSPQRVPDIGVM